MKCYFFYKRDSLNSFSSGRSIMNLSSRGSKESELVTLHGEEEVPANNLVAGSKCHTIQLGKKALKPPSFQRKIMTATFLLTRKRQPSGSINNQILMVPAKTNKILTIISELAKQMIGAFHIINGKTRD